MQLTKQEFDHFRHLIHQHCGIMVTEQKEYLIQQRLAPLVVSEGCSNFTEYYNVLTRNLNQTALNKMVEAITTHETSFFRDIHPFNTINQVILPELIAHYEQQQRYCAMPPKIRIWSAASSTGQEVYSLAIIIDEYLEQRKPENITLRNFEIIGTDISKEVLDYSKEGIYTDLEIKRGLSQARLQKYFNKVSKGWQVKPELRNIASFRNVNLAKYFQNMGAFDLILCRNVLIYFDEQVKKTIFQQFHHMLHKHSSLILGAMENTYCLSSQFTNDYYGNTIVYRKK